MKRLGVLLCALLFCLGCGSDGEKSQWDDALKDLRGDNMEMKGFGGMSEAHDRPMRPPSED